MMIIRSGFVSNSSSTSFLITNHGDQPCTLSEVMKFVAKSVDGSMLFDDDRRNTMHALGWDDIHIPANGTYETWIEGDDDEATPDARTLKFELRITLLDLFELPRPKGHGFEV